MLLPMPCPWLGSQSPLRLDNLQTAAGMRRASPAMSAAVLRDAERTSTLSSIRIAQTAAAAVLSHTRGTAGRASHSALWHDFC